MKKLFCIFAAALMVLCVGCKGGGGTAADPTQDVTVIPAVTETGTPAPTQTPAPVEVSTENSVVFTDGILTEGGFNWQYFYAKVSTNRGADVRLVNGSEVMTLSYAGGEFTLKTGGSERRFARIVRGTVAVSGGTAEICILTDDPSLTVESFFDGASADDAAVGLEKDGSLVIFVSVKKN